MSDQQSEFLSFAEVSRKAKVSPETVRRWVDKKLLRTHFMRGRQVVAASELDAFLKPQPLEPGTLLPGLSRRVDE